MSWQNNTVAELIHGPCDGAEIILPPSEKMVESIEVPLIVDMTSEWCKMVQSDDYQKILPIRLGIYRRDGATLRVRSEALPIVKFRYQETRNDTEAIE